MCIYVYNLWSENNTYCKCKIYNFAFTIKANIKYRYLKHLLWVHQQSACFVFHTQKLLVKLFFCRQPESSELVKLAHIPLCVSPCINTVKSARLSLRGHRWRQTVPCVSASVCICWQRRVSACARPLSRSLMTDASAALQLTGPGMKRTASQMAPSVIIILPSPPAAVTRLSVWKKLSDVVLSVQAMGNFFLQTDSCPIPASGPGSAGGGGGVCHRGLPTAGEDHTGRHCWESQGQG